MLFRSAINPAKKVVTVKNLNIGVTFEHPYSKLVYATGASAIVPEIPGITMSGVYTLRTLDDGLVLKDRLAKSDVERVVIVGGGYIGLEVAENLRMLGKQVRVVERAERILMNLDPEFSEVIREELILHDVQLHCGETLTSLNGDDGRLQSISTENGEYPCDVAILSIGVRPNCELAQKAGIALGFRNAVAVDRQMRTSVTDIFAAGDCAETYHRLLQRNVYIPLGTTSNRQGRLAGQNVCGETAEFAGVLGTAVAKIFDLAVATTGLTAQAALQEGMDTMSSTVVTLDHAVYYPNPRKIQIKLTYDKNTSVLLGGQIVGYEGVAHRIDILATAITQQMTLDELAEVDMCYAPPYKGVWDAVLVAANAARSEWEEKREA